MRCKLRVLRDIEIGEMKIPAGTRLVIDDDGDLMQVWTPDSGAPMNLRRKQVTITFGDSEEDDDVDFVEE
jgi:hypothetical protein